MIPANGVGVSHHSTLLEDTAMTELRQRMIRDMNLAGFTAGTQRAYLNGVRQLAKHYMLSPDKLTEKQVEEYVFYLREEKKVAKGTFQEYFYALRFLYENTLNYNWALFTKKKFVCRVRSVCPTLAAVPTAAL
jgi:predicted AAA+ superfamily ATPase